MTVYCHTRSRWLTFRILLYENNKLLAQLRYWYFYKAPESHLYSKFKAAYLCPSVPMRTLGSREVMSHYHPGLWSSTCLLPACWPTSGGPGEPGGGPGAALCCCFSSSICCREKKGRRREGGSSGWRRPHSSKLLGCRQRTCSRRFFLCRVLKWQYSQAKGLAPVDTGGMDAHTSHWLCRKHSLAPGPIQLTGCQQHTDGQTYATVPWLARA
jgi:hypothetical protein